MSTTNLNNTFLLSINCSEHSARQSYIFDLIFKKILGIDYVLVSENENPMLAYGLGKGVLNYKNHPFIYDLSIANVMLESVLWEGKKFPFKVDSESSNLPFDPFSVCFYFISRYEEYIITDRDKHQRFPASSSWLYQNDWLAVPIVNYIASIIKTQLEEALGIQIKINRKYSIHPTFDVDNPFAFYKREGGIFKSLIKSISSFDFKGIPIKWRAYKSNSDDPFFTYNKILSILKKHQLKAVFFFLMKSGKMNGNGGLDTAAFKQILSDCKLNEHLIGIHPSYNSYCSTKNISVEKRYLESKLNDTIDYNRFHYIQLSVTDSYPLLISQGIKADFTMGYPEISGFRAGICHSFNWFDLSKNKPTNLIIYPFYFMDATFIFNSTLDLKAAIKEITEITQQVKNYQGQNIFIFHNESISGYHIYKNWASLLSQSLAVVK